MPTAGQVNKGIYYQASQDWPCTINPYRLQVFLEGYEVKHKLELLDGIRYGFNIHSSLPSRLGCGYTNHKSALEDSSKVTAKLMKELELKRIAGPFDVPPPGLITSPLASVPKKDSQEIRLIHDLSFPSGNSVNEFIPREHCHVVYELIDDCIDIICELGQGCLIAKADIKNAFRILPIHPDCYKLLGFQWLDKYWFDKCMVMGCSSSCQTFEKLSNALQWILINKFNVRFMSHILDDFMFFGKAGSSQTKNGLNSFLQLCSSVGIQVKQEKTVLPSTVIELHGLLVDTVNMEIKLPQDKLSKALNLVSTMYKKKSVTLKELQSLIGLLNFCNKVVSPGRTFLRRLIDLTKGVTLPSHHIRLNNEARADLACWKQFLHNFNGVKLIKKLPWITSRSVKLFSDASFKACAAVYGNQWFQIKFPESWQNIHIAAKELLPVMLAFKFWAQQLKGVNVIFLVDNLAIVQVLNSKTAKDVLIMKMLRQMVVVSMVNNIEFSSKHIFGKVNIIPDLISRLQEDKALKIAPHLQRSPVDIPREWLPW